MGLGSARIGEKIGGKVGFDLPRRPNHLIIHEISSSQP